jgi:acylphosphatase
MTQRFLVRGRVQAVGFRWFVRDTARALAVTGSVRNLPDGRTVEVLATGDAAAMRRFADALRRGPPGSHVAQLEQHDATAAVANDGFYIVA